MRSKKDSCINSLVITAFKPVRLMALKAQLLPPQRKIIPLSGWSDSGMLGTNQLHGKHVLARSWPISAAL
jgi:hypothetical protein